MATSSKARSINIFLLDGETDGVRSAQIAMSTIHAIAFKRSPLVRVRNEFKEIARPPTQPKSLKMTTLLSSTLKRSSEQTNICEAC